MRFATVHTCRCFPWALFSVLVAAMVMMATDSRASSLDLVNGPVLSGIQETPDAAFELSGRWPAIVGHTFPSDSGPWCRWSAREQRRRDRDRANALTRALENELRGGLNTVNWRLHHFATCGNERDRSPLRFSRLLPGGDLHDRYLYHLDHFRAWASKLNGPILLRPFHEFNGGWFWWGKRNDPADFELLWRYTHKALSDLDIVWVWAGSAHGSLKIRNWWPGADYVDVVATSIYSNAADGGPDDPGALKGWDRVVELGHEVGKPVAIAEMGFLQSGRRVDNFWTDEVLPALMSTYREATYFLVWRQRWQAFIPYPDDPAGTSFGALFNDSYVLTLDEVSP